LATEIAKGGQRMQITGSRGLSWSQPGGSRGSTDRQRAAAAAGGGGGGGGGSGGGGGGDNVGYIHVSFRSIPVLSSLSLLLQAVFPSL